MFPISTVTVDREAACRMRCVNSLDQLGLRFPDFDPIVAILESEEQQKLLNSADLQTGRNLTDRTGTDGNSTRQTRRPGSIRCLIPRGSRDHIHWWQQQAHRHNHKSKGGKTKINDEPFPAWIETAIL